MSVNKLFALVLGSIISLMPLTVMASAKKTENKTQQKLTKQVKKTETKAVHKESKVSSTKKKSDKPLTQSDKQTKQIKKTEPKAVKDNKRITTKKGEAKQKTHHTKPSKKTKVKKEKQYGVKGAKLVPTKVIDKRYSYREKGKNHITIGKEASRLYSQTGVASYYGGMFHGRKTANGEIFNKNAFTAAHKTLALGSYALVTNLRNGRKVIVKINDRGPFSKNRIIDLSVAAAREIGMIHSGVARVKVEAMQVDRHGYVSGKGAESLLKIAKKSGLNLKVKGDGKHLAIKAE